MGFAFGPFLVPILYGLTGAWLPYLILGALVAVVLSLLLVLLVSPRVQIRWPNAARDRKPQNETNKDQSAEKGSSLESPDEKCAAALEIPGKNDGDSEKGAEACAAASWPSEKAPENTVKATGPGSSLLLGVKAIVRNQHALPGIAVLFTEALATSSLFLIMPLLLSNTCHRSVIISGLVVGALALSYAAVSYFVTPRMVERAGDIHTMALGMVITGVALSVVTLHGLCDQLWAQFLLMAAEGKLMTCHRCKTSRCLACIV